MNLHAELWKSPYSWEELKEITLFGYFMSWGEGIFMVTDENPHLPYFYGFPVAALRDGQLECPRTYSESFDKDLMHSKISQGRGYLTRQYDAVLEDSHKQLAAIEVLKEAFSDHEKRGS